jgi:hypothetical protein
MSLPFDLSLSRLGLGEYSEALLSRGFDSWDRLIDINEETMAELGIRLGHRRKLQREIATYRGQPQTQPLVCPPAVEGLWESEEPKSPCAGRDELEIEEPTPLKRRYRHRRPKDPHAPRKPSSDYVLFGKYLRQDPDVSKFDVRRYLKACGRTVAAALAGRAGNVDIYCGTAEEQIHYGTSRVQTVQGISTSPR